MVMYNHQHKFLMMFHEIVHQLYYYIHNNLLYTMMRIFDDYSIEENLNLIIYLNKNFSKEKNIYKDQVNT